MEFKKITIENFLSYYDKNEIEFSPATTIFIGQNNTGKSKLFDAINFALYGRIFPTDKGSNGEWISDENEIAPLILNNHKKNVALQNNEGKIKVSVSLDFEDGTSLINVERTFLYKKVENDYKYAGLDFSVTELDSLNGKLQSSDTGEGAKAKLGIYFDSAIKDFFLFQGEAASKIMQLQKGGNFSKAVREIARLSVFEEAKQQAQAYEKHVNNLTTRKINKNKEQREKQETLQNQIDEKENEIEEIEDAKIKAEKNVADYQVILESNEEKLSQFKEFEEYLKQKNILKENSKKVETELKNLQAEKSQIAEESVFYKIREKINHFKSFYEKLEEKGEVPPSIPAAEIKKSLDCCCCAICGADLSEGTKRRAFAESRLPKCDTDKLGNYLRELNHTFGDEVEEVMKIPEKLYETLDKKRQAEERKLQLIKEKNELSETLSSVEFDEATSKEKQKEANELRESISRYTTFLENAKREASKNEGRLEQINFELKKLKSEQNSLIVQDDEIDESDKIKNYYATKLSDAMNRLYKIAHDTAYSEVEKRADEYYKEMTQENSALVGSIKIDTATSEIYTVDENQNRIRNINQGNRISIQLAVIAGILTVAQEQFGQQYPFVTDAPVSALGGDNKISTIKTMINAFEQSIIIIKDDTSSKNKTNDEIPIAVSYV